MGIKDDDKKKSRKLSIQGISRLTGYSTSTVSNALNHKKGVNADTAKRIQKVASQAGYHGNTIISRIRIIIFRHNGGIIESVQFAQWLVEGVEQEAKEAGMECVISYLDGEGNYADQIQTLLNDSTAGFLILASEMTEAEISFLAKRSEPIVFLDSFSEEVMSSSVLAANVDAAYNAVSYLIKNGHRKIGYIHGELQINAFSYRELGYERAMREHGLDIDPNLQVTVGTTIESAYKKMKDYLEKSPELPTAYFADNDLIAISAMRAIKEKGIRVPEDVSFIGIDDIPYASVSEPRLTTMHVFRHQMGKLAVQRLREKVRDPDSKDMLIEVRTELTIRDSVRKIVTDGCKNMQEEENGKIKD